MDPRMHMLTPLYRVILQNRQVIVPNLKPHSFPGMLIITILLSGILP